MRITTWNCNRGQPRPKLDAVAKCRSELLVVQECARLDQPPANYLWRGDYVKQGVHIQAFGEYQLCPVPERPNVPPFVVPVQVDGPQRFMLFAVWTKATPRQQYVRGLNDAVDIYEDLIADQPCVIIGDFNSNAIWDKLHPRDRNHSALVARLDKLGLESAYHAHYKEAHGSETRPTYFQYRREAEPFHIDYCFVPKAWRERLKGVEVGAHADWTNHSDHVPMTVEFADG